jgi:hypothetical protein
MSLILDPAGLTVTYSEHAIKHLDFSEAQHNVKRNRLEERFGSEAHKVPKKGPFQDYLILDTK